MLIDLKTFKEEGMLNASFFNELNAKIKDILKQSPARDIEKNIRALLRNTFTKLDLITREEFEVQTQVLKRSRDKITALEAKIAELEQKFKK